MCSLKLPSVIYFDQEFWPSKIAWCSLAKCICRIFVILSSIGFADYGLLWRFKILFSRIISLQLFGNHRCRHSYWSVGVGSWVVVSAFTATVVKIVFDWWPLSPCSFCLVVNIYFLWRYLAPECNVSCFKLYFTSAPLHFKHPW